MHNILNINVKVGPRWRCKLFVLLLLFTPSVTASTTELVWDRTPIPLDLEVGTERLVHFPQSMSIGLPANLQSVVRVQSIGKTIYLLANAPFDRTRVLMRSTADGSVMVIDLAASSEPTESKNVFIRQRLGTVDPHKEHHELNYAVLTRFAAQFAYAPSRLIHVPKGVLRAAKPKSAKGLVRSVSVESIPYAAWKTNSGLYVTAIRLVNTSDEAVELHPNLLRGKWLTATFHHYRLLPRESGADQTLVYLISRFPFKQAKDL